nr:hypothetical protein [Tanacetum cinerariifolium]
MPPKPDLSFTGLDVFVNKPVVDNCEAKSSDDEPKVVRKNDDAPIIEDWVLDNEKENVSQPKIEKKTVRPSIVKKEFFKPRQQEKTARKTVKQCCWYTSMKNMLSSYSCCTQVNAAFSTNINNLSDVVIYAFLDSQTNSSQLAHEDLEQIHLDDMEKVNLRLQMVMLTMRARRAPRNQDFKHKESTRWSVQTVDNCKKGLGYKSYNAVPPPYIGNFMPPKPDLSFTSLDKFANKPVDENTKSSEEETKAIRKNSDAPIIEEWVS